MARIASKVYGDALFQLAVEKNLTESLYEEADQIRRMILSDESLSQVMDHPMITREEKEATLQRILEGNFSKEMQGFFHIILEKRRYKDADAILSYFQEQVKEYRHIGVAYIRTPMEVNDRQKEQIEQQILKASPYETLECHYSVEPELMGGMIIRIGDRVVDSTLKSQLDRMSKNLLHLQIGKKV